MAKQLLRITAVEYLNTALFVEGLKHNLQSNNFELSLDNPAECARKIQAGEADIGLVPVAKIPEIEPEFIFGNYCIGASGPVRTVKLFSHKPIKDLSTVILDPHSRSSAMLLKVLCKEYWMKEVLFEEGENGFENTIHSQDEGILVIGDKVFAIENRYKYSYDLAYEWIKYTNQHFVFAAWVSKIDLSDNRIEDFHAALRYGLDKKNDLVENWMANAVFGELDVLEYLSKNISYSFDEKKRAGLELFLKLAGLPIEYLRYR